MAKSGHRQDSDPFLQFVDECCLQGEGQSALCDDLYLAYRGFCESSGKMPRAKPEFGKQIGRLQGIRRDRESNASRRFYVYVGIGLLPTVLTTSQFNVRGQHYQAPYRPQPSPRAGLRLAVDAEASPETPQDTLGLPPRGMNPGMT